MSLCMICMPIKAYTSVFPLSAEMFTVQPEESSRWNYCFLVREREPTSLLFKFYSLERLSHVHFYAAIFLTVKPGATMGMSQSRREQIATERLNKILYELTFVILLNSTVSPQWIAFNNPKQR